MCENSKQKHFSLQLPPIHLPTPAIWQLRKEDLIAQSNHIEGLCR